MPNQRPGSFPSTQRDISNLKQTATDAASDISDSVTDAATKAKGQFKDLAGHVQEEGGDQLARAQGQFREALQAAGQYISDRPLACVSVALALGFLLGFARRTSSR